MPMFWSKKSKAEKTYDKTSASATQNVPGKKRAPGMKASKTPAKKAVKSPSSGAVTVPSGFSGADAIIRPRITEKSGILAQGGVYTFEVTKYANKPMIARAVKALYKVTAVKVTVLNLPARKVFLRGKKGSVPGVRKAMVTVKKGETIDFV